MEKLITLNELAKRLGCHPATIYRLASGREIPYVRIGRTGGYRFDYAEVLKALRVETGKTSGRARR